MSRASFQNASGDLSSLNTDVNSRITADVQQINSIAAAISTLNQQIVVATAQGGNQPPNELLDQRDQLVSNLSQLVGVSTTTEGERSLERIRRQRAAAGAAGPDHAIDHGAKSIQCLAAGNRAPRNGNQISSDITSGDLGGLLAARTQVINPALNQLGQVATALSQTVNSQQSDGLDLNGNLGAQYLLRRHTGRDRVIEEHRCDDRDVKRQPQWLGALTADNYVLTYKAARRPLTDTSAGANVTLPGAGTVASPYTANGVSIVLSGAPAAGDQFLIQPTATAAAASK